MGLLHLVFMFPVAFKGDLMMLTAARQEIRTKLEVSRDLLP